MSTLRVFLAPDGPAGGVPGVLADLSAAGLVAPYLWVGASQVGRHSARAVKVEGGARTCVSVEDELSTPAVVHARLCVVVPLGEDEEVVDAEVENLLSNLILTSGHAPTPPTRIRCIVGRLGEHAAVDDVARQGWHNVYVAPEDAEGPVGGRVALHVERADVVDSGRHAAPTIAGIVGLWTGVDECVFDGDTNYLPGARAARCFYRRVDAAEVEHDLRRRVLATAGGVPRPNADGTEAVYVTDPAKACADMADLWWALHEKDVIGPTKRVAPFVPEELTIRAALRMFARWARETLRRQPRNLIDGMQNRVKITAAAGVQKALFSDDRRSPYQVVVHGRSGNRLPVGLRELGAPAEELDRTIVAEGTFGAPAGLPDLSPMWRDYVEAAFTLVDGGSRNAKLPRLDRDGRPAVLNDPERAVPAAGQAFVLPGSLASRVGTDLHRLLPGDVVAVRQLDATLPALAADDVTLRGEVADAQAGLAEWNGRHARTFAGQVATRIDDARTGTLHRIVQYLGELDEAAAFTPDPSPPGRSRMFWVLTGLLAVVAVPAALLTAWLGAALLPWWVAVAGALLVPVGWVGWAALEHGRDLWALEQAGLRTSALAAKYEAAVTNLRQALLDLRVLAAAYALYRVYTPIAGAVLREPFGPDPDAPHRPATIAHGLPRSVRIAWGQATHAAVGTVAERLRREIFQTSWLSRPWRTHCETAGTRLDSYRLRQDGPEAVFDLQGGGTAGTDLERWSAVLTAEGTTAEPGDQRWRELLDDIRVRGDLDEQLLSSVQELGRPATTLREFLASVDQPDENIDGQRFLPDHFTFDAQVRGAHTIREQRKLTEQGLGLSRVHVLVQMGRPVVARDFTATPTRGAGDGGPPPPPPPVPVPPGERDGLLFDERLAPPAPPPAVPPVPAADI